MRVSLTPKSRALARRITVAIPMRIGTPLSPSATKVLLLGSGELGKEVIVALQRLLCWDRGDEAALGQAAFALGLGLRLVLRGMIREWNGESPGALFSAGVIAGSAFAQVAVTSPAPPTPPDDEIIELVLKTCFSGLAPR